MTSQLKGLKGSVVRHFTCSVTVRAAGAIKAFRLCHATFVRVVRASWTFDWFICTFRTVASLGTDVSYHSS